MRARSLRAARRRRDSAKDRRSPVLAPAGPPTQPNSTHLADGRLPPAPGRAPATTRRLAAERAPPAPPSSFARRRRALGRLRGRARHLRLRLRRPLLDARPAPQPGAARPPVGARRRGRARLSRQRDRRPRPPARRPSARHSPALIADGNHARVDAFVSLGVIASAAVVALGLEIADPLIGLGITLVIVKITWDSWRIARDPPRASAHSLRAAHRRHADDSRGEARRAHRRGIGAGGVRSPGRNCCKSSTSSGRR